MMASPNAPGAFFGHDMSGTGQVVCCVGGTSLSAPLWAGLSRNLAEIIGQTRLGNLNTIIYQLANQQYATAGFHDVTIGNNGYNGLPGFNAGPGYDQATGWGTVDFAVFANAVNILLNPNATPTPTATPTATPTVTPSPTPTPTPTGGVLSAPATLTFPATATGKPGSIKTLMIRNLSRTTALSLAMGSLAAPFAVSGSSALYGRAEGQPSNRDSFQPRHLRNFEAASSNHQQRPESFDRVGRSHCDGARWEALGTHEGRIDGSDDGDGHQDGRLEELGRGDAIGERTIFRRELAVHDTRRSGVVLAASPDNHKRSRFSSNQRAAVRCRQPFDRDGESYRHRVDKRIGLREVVMNPVPGR